MPTLPVEYASRADANESAFIQRALNQVETETYNTEFPPLEGMKHVPVDEKFDEGALSFEYRKYTRTGIAKLVTGRGKDLPTSGVFVQSYTRKFYDLGACYRYSLRDLTAAAFASRNGQPINIEMETASGARTAIERGLDAVCGIGSATSSTIPGLSQSIGADVGMLGLLNQTSASTYTVATGAGGSTAWSLKTPDEILADMHGICRSIITSTYKVFKATRLLLPIDQEDLIRSTRMGDGSDESILSLFMKQRPGVTVDSWQYCEGAGTGGSDRMVAFQAEPRVVRHVLSLRFKQLPPEYRNREFKTDCLARTAGVVSQYPIGICYADNI
jgi:hypothetical protein